MRALIIDDENHCIESLAWKLQEYCHEVEVLGKFQSPVAAMEFLQDNIIDIIFLDIEMPKITGFDLIKLHENHSAKIVLTTAFEKYALAAIKAGVFDYLLKPIDHLELIDLINRIKKSVTESDITFKSPRRVISIATQESIEFALPEEILYCQAQSNYSIVHFKNKRQKMISKTLKEFEIQLEGFNFFRTHQSYLVNLKYVKAIKKNDFGQLVLIDDTEIPITKVKKMKLLELMK